MNEQLHLSSGDYCAAPAGFRRLSDAVFALLAARFDVTSADGGPDAAFLLERAKAFHGVSDWPRCLAALAAAPADEDRALVSLAAAFGFNLVELATCALVRAVEADLMAGRAMTFLQAPLGTSRPLIGLLSGALRPLRNSASGSMESSIAAGRPIQVGLLELEGQDLPLPERTLRIPTPLVLALDGQQADWPGVKPLVRIEAGHCPDTIADAIVRQTAALTASDALVIRTVSEVDLALVLQKVAKEFNLQPVRIDPRTVETRGLGVFCTVRRILPVFSFSLAPGESAEVPALPGFDGPLILSAGPDGGIIAPGRTVIDWPVPLPSRAERSRAWAKGPVPEALSQTLADVHLCGIGRILDVNHRVAGLAALAGRDQANMADVRAALGCGSGEGLGALAQPILESVPDDALILGNVVRAELDLLLNRCRNRETLAQNMGTTLQVRYKVGVRCLLSGPSGTGKTLAAAWLATRLGMPLYRVDLASVTSKYIGETEKNLARLLAQAEQDDVVLLFDEADSMFGKRTDIQDANDRHANAQTNYLLQRIENYCGIVVLTSNSRSRFDTAFIRRIDSIVEFPLPRPEERRSLWQVHLGDNHRLDRAQLNELAALVDFPGGHIRNAVLTAAVLAAKEQAKITLDHIIAALKVEYRKLGGKMPGALARRE